MQSLRENYVFRFTVCTIWDQRTTLWAKTPCIGPFLVKVFMSPSPCTFMQDLMLCKCLYYLILLWNYWGKIFSHYTGNLQSFNVNIVSTWNHIGTNGKVCSLVLCASVCQIYFSILSLMMIMIMIMLLKLFCCGSLVLVFVS